MSYGDINLGQHWLKWWLVGWRHKFITWTNVNLPKIICGFHLRNFALSTHNLNSSRPDEAFIRSDNGLSPGRCQAIIWINAGLLLIRTLGTNFKEIVNKIHAFSFKKMHLEMLSAKWRQFCLGFSVLVRNCTSENYVIIDLATVCCQAIIWTSVDILTCTAKLGWIVKTVFFIHENAFRNIVCHNSAILSGPYRTDVNMLWQDASSSSYNISAFSVRVILIDVVDVGYQWRRSTSNNISQSTVKSLI